ncbi:hypothetical protein EW145_g5737 [Phellinidium pouzarii]|uniref:Uncharacterized protein n=1 Tax=Phellinidium pouzarii TaxID=167371 RepID=A0A4S4L0A5_9AGAM|nr:hypothetical protein EW145_g5737 [Phellinidium pouzarii]
MTSVLPSPIFKEFKGDSPFSGEAHMREHPRFYGHLTYFPISPLFLPHEAFAEYKKDKASSGDKMSYQEAFNLVRIATTHESRRAKIPHSVYLEYCDELSSELGLYKLEYIDGHALVTMSADAYEGIASGMCTCLGELIKNPAARQACSLVNKKMNVRHHKDIEDNILHRVTQPDACALVGGEPAVIVEVGFNSNAGRILFDKCHAMVENTPCEVAIGVSIRETSRFKFPHPSLHTTAEWTRVAAGTTPAHVQYYQSPSNNYQHIFCGFMTISVHVFLKNIEDVVTGVFADETVINPLQAGAAIAEMQEVDAAISIGMRNIALRHGLPNDVFDAIRIIDWSEVLENASNANEEILCLLVSIGLYRLSLSILALISGLSLSILALISGDSDLPLQPDAFSFFSDNDAGFQGPFEPTFTSRRQFPTQVDAQHPRVDISDDNHFVQSFPEDYFAGAPIDDQKHQTTFERLQDMSSTNGNGRCGPFADRAEWDLAKWIVKNIGHGQADELLALDVLRSRSHPSFHNSRSLYQKIDGLPGTQGWNCQVITVAGDFSNPDGSPASEEYELWSRDAFEIVRDLLGNPAFKDHMAYAPERIYCDNQGKSRRYDEVWTGDWWWNIQVYFIPLSAYQDNL